MSQYHTIVCKRNPRGMHPAISRRRTYEWFLHPRHSIGQDPEAHASITALCRPCLPKAFTFETTSNQLPFALSTNFSLPLRHDTRRIRHLPGRSCRTARLDCPYLLNVQTNPARVPIAPLSHRTSCNCHNQCSVRLFWAGEPDGSGTNAWSGGTFTISYP